MKSKGTTHGVAWLTPAAAVLLAALLSTSAPAQSGRIIRPTPTPTPEPAPKRAEEPKFVPDPKADRYRLVYTTRYSGDFEYDSDDELALARRSAFDNFAEHLNRAGAEGYRLVTSLKGDPAVVMLGDAQYEYAWTETGARVESLKTGFPGTYARLAKLGFRLAAHSLLYAFCAPFPSDRCEYRDFFLFERRKGDEAPREHAYVRTERGGNHEEILTAGLRAKLSEKFYPAFLLSKGEILLEREPPDPVFREPGVEVRVVRSSSFWERDELPKKANELGRQGFRLALVNNEIAVMCRRPGEAAPYGYVWLKSSKKDFDRELARLQESAAVFRSTYPDANGARTSLIFEQGRAGAARREYRVLRFELQTRRNRAERVLETALAPASADAQAELNRLASEGFAVLALFDADRFNFTRPSGGREGLMSEEFGVLLERRR